MKIVGIGTRVLNFLVDTAVVFLIAYILFKTRNWYVFYYKVKAYNLGWFFFGTLFVYYFILESLFARTLGKWFSISKVVDRNGKRPGVVTVFIRSLVRVTIIDMFFIPFLDKPLHDYLSKTEVIEA